MSFPSTFGWQLTACVPSAGAELRRQQGLPDNGCPPAGVWQIPRQGHWEFVSNHFFPQVTVVTEGMGGGVPQPLAGLC